MGLRAPRVGAEFAIGRCGTLQLSQRAQDESTERTYRPRPK